MTSDDKSAPPKEPEFGQSDFVIVGVGASAGGLEAFTELLQHLPPDTGMAFVLVQHLDPNHESMLPDLLSSKTAMAVVEATDDLRMAPNTVYAAPAAQDVTVEHGVLKLIPRPPSGLHLPFDLFLESLALDRSTHAVAVVLSGTASDGSAGVQAVKQGGGMTMAQDPSTAKYRGMPESAIATGAVDLVLPIPLLAQQLTIIAGHPDAAPLPPQDRRESPLRADDSVLADLLAIVRSATQADFAHYKRSTVLRRIRRRMMLRHEEDLEAYLKLLRKDSAEVEALYQDLLIRVTSFFRQPQVFETLKQDVFPQIAGSQTDGQVRFWVPGCASGEEAYSLAMAWSEFTGDNHLDKTSFQIFASDINQQVIDKARQAVYPESIVADVSPERLGRFFSRFDDGYRIVSSIREACVFARHDLTRDPPFSRLDLISLRNVLIYLGPLLQRRVMPLLHFALRSGGFLLLGESESVGGFADLFSLVHKKDKIYVARSVDPSHGPPFTLPPAEAEVTTPTLAPAAKGYDLSKEADRIVLDSYAPAGVIIDADLQIRRFRGHTGPYLEPGPGRVSFDLLRMAREGLAGELSTALREAKKGGAAVRRRGIRILRDDEVVAVGFDVLPLTSPTGEASFLVLFHEMPLADREASGAERTDSTEAADDLSGQIAELERELSEMREYVRAVLEDKESANEELRSANEELQSSNEELQSVNEELETASEEVQSANEELRTLNEELHALNERLAALNEDLKIKNEQLRELNIELDAREVELKRTRDYALAIIDTIREPLLVLDPDLVVVSASPPFYDMFKTRARDTLGRSLFALDGRCWDIAELRDALTSVAAGTNFKDFVVDREMPRLGRRTMVLSGRHIHTAGGGTENVLLAIEDITERAQAEVLSEALDGINLTMISTIDYDELLERAMIEAERALGCDEAVLAVLVDGSWITRFSAGASWAVAGAAVPDRQARQFSALSIGQRALVSTASLERRAGLSSSEAGKRVLHVPLSARDRVVGALSLVRHGRKATFTETELGFIDKLSPALSIALENAKLHANEHRIAEVLQTSLLKPILSVPGVEIGLAYRPAHMAELVGGDFYDLFSMENDCVAMVVGDVSGKGVYAASLTETVRATLRALALIDFSPSSILTKANRLLLAELPDSQFCTVLLAMVDVTRGKVTISSAGHPPPVVCGEHTRFLDVDAGTPLGALSGLYSEAEYDLLSGETILLYTDGLTEARRGTDFFGEQGLVEALAGQECSDAVSVVDAVMSRVTEYAGSRLSDDLAIIAARLVSPDYRGGDAVADSRSEAESVD